MNPEKIAFLTDSTADLYPNMREGKPIYVVPLKISCVDGDFSDGVDIHSQDIYERLHRGELPKTSLPEGGVVSDTLDRIRADGYEKVIAVTLSSGVSGTYNMMRLMAGQRHDLDVRVFDSKSGALGIGIIILELCEEMENGACWEELVEQRAPHLIAHTKPFFSVDTLEYLRRGGRIGRITAMAGTLLQIKPIISLDSEGYLKTATKVRGRRQVQDKLIDLLQELFDERCRHVPHPRYNLSVANGGVPGEMEELARKMCKVFPDYQHFWGGNIGATLSVYIGDGVLGAGIQFLD